MGIKSRAFRALACAAVFFAASAFSPASATPTTTGLYTFDGYIGALPTNGTPLLAGKNLFVATNSGGGADDGTIVEYGLVSVYGERIIADIHAFTGPDGSHPNGNLVMDASGSLYGTTQEGGANGIGTIFKLSPTSTPYWVLTTLHSFTCDEGGFPQAGLTMGPDGSLYGTTYASGPLTGLNSACSSGGSALGSLFKISAGGAYRIVHSFQGTPDGFKLAEGGRVLSNVVLDPAGDMIVTTSLGSGTVSGQLVIVHPNGSSAIVGNGSEFAPYAANQLQGNIARDAAGNVYGMIGATLWKISAITHVFTAIAVLPNSVSRSGVVRDSYGNFYGTITGETTFNTLGRTNGGVFVFSGLGKLLMLDMLSADNAFPIGGVISDGTGNIYGSSSAGGLTCDITTRNVTTSGCGTIFEISP